MTMVAVTQYNTIYWLIGWFVTSNDTLSTAE